MAIPWIDVDLSGLAKLNHDPSSVIRELVSNCLDTDATRITVALERIAGRRGVASVTVEDDDPTGFSNLAHAWTMFAESTRKADPTKRGRFCLGEKMVLALCEEASIETTTGSVRFDKDGRHVGRKKREKGSVFRATMKLTREHVERARALVRSLILPSTVVLTLDGAQVPSREPIRAFEAKLPTEFAGKDGNLRRTTRSTTVRLYAPVGDEAPHIFELGVPVVELDQGEPWHVDVGQKVQLTLDRENVTPSFMRETRLALLNSGHDLLRDDDAKATWTREALGDERVSNEAVRAIARLRHGENAVAADPSDREAEKRAASKDVPVVHGGSATAEEWDSFRRAGVLQPAGRVYPSPRPYSDDPTAPKARVIPKEEWTAEQRSVATYAAALAPLLLEGHEVRVLLVEADRHFRACFGGGELHLNCVLLGRRWFEAAARGDTDDLNGLLVHEFGHHYSSDHLSERFHEALCSLAAKLARVALLRPALLRIDSPGAV